MQLISNYQQSAIGYTVGVYGTAIVCLSVHPLWMYCG